MKITVGKVVLFLMLLFNVVSGYSATSENIQSQTPPPPTPPPGLPVDENIFWLAVIGTIFAFIIYKNKKNRLHN